MTTKTAQQTLQTALDKADPNILADLLQQLKLGTALKALKVDTGVQAASATWSVAQILAAAGYVQPGVDGVAPTKFGKIKTVRVVASGTAASVGAYCVTDSGGTPALPAGGANAGLGVATISDDETTLTFPNTVTHIIVEFYPEVAVDLGTAFP